MANQNIFQISQDLEDIFFELEENGGELTDELQERLAITQDNLKLKLEGYRKAYSNFNADASKCKEEEKRLSNICKTKENNANRLKAIMQTAVEQFGDIGKSGNKVITLFDSRLYTSTSKCTEINENLVQCLIDSVLSLFNEAYSKDMLKQFAEEIFHDSQEEFINKVNGKFIELYPEQSKNLFINRNTYFTLDDLSVVKVQFTISKPLISLSDATNIDLVETFFNHDFEMTRSSDIDKTSIKNRILDGQDISIGKVITNTNLIIK